DSMPEFYLYPFIKKHKFAFFLCVIYNLSKEDFVVVPLSYMDVHQRKSCVFVLGALDASRIPSLRFYMAAV
ncbi:hypothetical protein STEG23_007919, partial [Scotinomys teguina]